MKPDIFVKRVENALANGKTGIQITLFRHDIVLTAEEADELQQGLMFVLSVEKTKEGE